MKELLVRAMSGAVYVALVLGAAWMGQAATALLFLPITAIAAAEWHRLVWKDHGDGPPLVSSVVVAVIAYAAWAGAPWFPEPHFHWSIGIVLLTLTIAIVSGLLMATTRPAAHIGHHLSMTFLLAFPMACASFMAAEGAILIGFMLLLWTNDTGAYLVGKAIGRHKLMPRVSPGKTWEGFLGGLILSLGTAWAIHLWIDLELDGRTWLVAAIAVSITATIGDLFESAMKRAAGVKDSGTLMPGHGGALDRFDGYLLAAPTMVLIAYLLH